MHPQLFDVPIYVLAALLGAVAIASFFGDSKHVRTVILSALAVGGAAGLFACTQPWGHNALPVRSYGAMILVGFLAGVWMAARRAPRLGIEPRHCMDVGVWGVVVGLLGARILHILMNWPAYTPFHNGFDFSRIWSMLAIWRAGLAFFGVVIAVLPFTFLYCRWHGVPGVPFLDLALPSLIAGQAFGRIGCFFFGCCYGKLTSLPWGVHFPPGAPAYNDQLDLGIISDGAACSAAVHPTELYAVISGFLVAAFLYAYWPRRRFDGQILSLALIMAGVTRFLEELLRADEPAAFASVPWLTTSHWLALSVVAAGTLLLIVFKRRGTLYKAELKSCSGDAGCVAPQ